MTNKNKGKWNMKKGIMPGRKKMEEGNTNVKEGNWRIFLVPFLIFLFCSALGAWFGQDTCPAHYLVGTGYADAQRFQASEDGTSTRLELRTYTMEPYLGTFRMSVYDDNSGSPNNKLWEGTDISYLPGGWCGEDVTTISITANNYYWFAFKVNTTEEMCYDGSGPANFHKWKSGQTYANPFPNPWGSSSGSNTNRYSMRMHYTPTAKKGTGGIIQDEESRGIIEGGIIR